MLLSVISWTIRMGCPMAQKEIEVILIRQLASYLSVPILIVDPMGTLLFYNEPAEQLLAMRFEETGEIPADEWINSLKLTDAHGMPVAPEGDPLMIALHERRPAHGELWGQGRDGVRRHVEATAFPVIGQAGRHLGAVAMFWEVK